mmetsp:Transcript_40867/g.63792  ORF Transcript_40867/g.63792 Transcript_40867/m.63792 type:complete len:302 (+) Transcript_40867:205-1110(+)
MEESIALVEVAERHSSRRVLSKAGSTGIVRLVTKGEKQLKDYQKCQDTFPNEVQLVDTQACRDLQGVGQNITKGLRVQDGLALNGSLYIQGLWEACTQLGDINWAHDHIHSLQTFEDTDVDVVVVCCGAASKSISELAPDLPVTPVRAQNIRYVPNPDGPKGPSLSVPVISGRYLVPFESEDAFWLYGGATQENSGFWGPADLRVALDEIHDQLVSLYEPLASEAWLAVEAKAGVKGCPPRGVGSPSLAVLFQMCFNSLYVTHSLETISRRARFRWLGGCIILPHNFQNQVGSRLDLGQGA